jgi:hypothetical protein
MDKEVKERIQVSDPLVTRRKFDRELQRFWASEANYNERGIFCYRAEFPQLYFLFVGVKLTPSPVLFAVKMDFTNYDAEPPSVRVIEPFSGKLYQRREEIKVKFEQTNHGGNDILQGNGTITPFFCIPGIYEYHNHHYHTGDSWYRHRSKGYGTLDNILSTLHSYTVRRIHSYSFHLTTASIDFIQEPEQPPINLPITPDTNTQ